MVIAAIAEGLTMQLVSIWFFFGALVAAVTAFFGLTFPMQFILFVVVSFGCLVATRPFVRKWTQSLKAEPTNADRNIGKVGVVTEEINNTLGTGRVTVAGNDWTARTVDDTVVSQGEKVTVESISGVKLMVSRQ